MPTAVTLIGMTIVNSVILTQVAIAVVTMAVTTLVGSLFRPKAPEIESQARKVTIRSGVAPCRVIYGQYFGGGVLVYAATSGGNEKYLHLVIVHCCHEVEAIEQVWFGDLISTSNRFFGFIRVNHHLGTEDQLADADLVHDVGAWTDEHRLRGCAYTYIRLTFDDDEDDPLWTSVPQIKFLVKGKNDIEDPRTGQKGYTNNWALCVRDYLMYKNGMNVTADRLPHNEWVAAANVCDEPFQGKPKYVMNGGFTLDGQPPDILEGMKSAAQGQIVYTGGLWVAKPAAYDAPVKVITTDDLVEDIVVTPAQSKFDTANIVAGSFVEPRALWASTSYPPVKDQANIDRYRAATDTVDFPWTIDVHIAQMLAGIRLGHMMHSAGVSLQCNLSAMDIRAWDVIELDIPEIWDKKQAFRVVAVDMSMQGVTLVCSEENPDIYVPVATTDIDIPDRVTIGNPGNNQPPVASFVFRPTGLLVAFTDLSIDPDGTIESWAWDFGDGATSPLQNPSHTYANNGTYTVSLTVTDDDGAINTTTRPVTVPTTVSPSDGLAVSGEYWTWDGHIKLMAGGTWGGEPHLYEQKYSGHGITINDASDFLGSELAKIAGAKGNYFRCTLVNFPSPYVTGGKVYDTVFPFAGSPGHFDLSTMSQDWIDRVDALLYRCEALDIVVQLEMFDTWWCIKNHWTPSDMWWNPDNVDSPADYTFANTKLVAAQQSDNRLFTNPALANEVANPLLIAQKKLVDTVCTIAARHKNALIQIQNESIEPTAWADFWKDYINAKSLGLFVTEMQDEWDLATVDARHAMVTAGYAFGDSSQQWHDAGTSGNSLDDEWTKLLGFHGAGAKPVNTVKIYSRWNNVTGGIGHDKAVDFMFISFVAGNAACAFHPGNGGDAASLGTSSRALDAMRAGDWLNVNSDIETMAAVPLGDSKWTGRPSQQAWACAGPDHIAIYVTGNAGLKFNTTSLGANMSMRWYKVYGGNKTTVTSMSTSNETNINNPFGDAKAIVIFEKT